jgi:hypothetical protein
MKKNNLNFVEALDLVMGGNVVYSYDGYRLMNHKGNLYMKHMSEDRRKRLINHDELQLLKDKLFYIKDTDTPMPYSRQLK